MDQSFKPFKVTFRFRTPIVLESEYPIHLDALLAWAITQEEADVGHDSWAFAEDLSLWLDSAENANGKVWKASRLIFTPLRERGQINMIRKSDPETIMRDLDAGHFGHTRTISSINTRSGQYRAYQMLVPYQWMEKAEAWGVGDIGEVKKLLGHLINIGKQARNGFGLIESFIIELDPSADVKWALRILPIGMPGISGVDYAPVLHCLSVPYWQKTNRVLAMEPIV